MEICAMNVNDANTRLVNVCKYARNCIEFNLIRLITISVAYRELGKTVFEKTDLDEIDKKTAKVSELIKRKDYLYSEIIATNQMESTYFFTSIKIIIGFAAISFILCFISIYMLAGLTKRIIWQDEASKPAQTALASTINSNRPGPDIASLKQSPQSAQSYDDMRESTKIKVKELYREADILYNDGLNKYKTDNATGIVSNSKHSMALDLYVQIIDLGVFSLRENPQDIQKTFTRSLEIMAELTQSDSALESLALKIAKSSRFNSYPSPLSLSERVMSTYLDAVEQVKAEEKEKRDDRTKRQKSSSNQSYADPSQATALNENDSSASSAIQNMRNAGTSTRESEQNIKEMTEQLRKRGLIK